jgi:hypothetical protein
MRKKVVEMTSGIEVVSLAEQAPLGVGQAVDLEVSAVDHLVEVDQVVVGEIFVILYTWNHNT